MSLQFVIFGTNKPKPKENNNKSSKINLVNLNFSIFKRHNFDFVNFFFYFYAKQIRILSRRSLKFGGSEPKITEPGTTGINMLGWGFITIQSTTSGLKVRPSYVSKGHHGADVHKGATKVPLA